MEEMYGDIIERHDVFANNLISENDIGSVAMKTILKSFEQLIDVLDDVIFMLDEDNADGKEEKINSE